MRTRVTRRWSQTTGRDSRRSERNRQGKAETTGPASDARLEAPPGFTVKIDGGNLRPLIFEAEFRGARRAWKYTTPPEALAQVIEYADHRSGEPLELSIYRFHAENRSAGGTGWTSRWVAEKGD